MKRAVLVILLACVASATAPAQMNIMLRAGNYLKMRRDSVLALSLDSVRLRAEIRDSLNNIPRAGAAATDTITTDAHPRAFTGGTDTLTYRFFRGGGYQSTGAYREIQCVQATGDWVLKKIAITHSWEDSQTSNYYDRDTLYILPANNTVIPRGSHVFICYLPKESYARSSEPRASEQCQQVGVYHVAPNSAGAVLPSGTKVQIPLLLGLNPPVGIMDDHLLTVTLTFYQK